VVRRRRLTILLCALALLASLLALSLSGCATRGTTGNMDSSESPTTVGGNGVKTIYLAGGCFWGLEKYLGLIDGVVSTETGYANGASESAKYGDGSGYAEAVRVDYDPEVAPLAFLLKTFFAAIDPTSVDRQGNDTGTEYRSGIYYTDPADATIIEVSLQKLQANYDKPIAIESGPLKNYARAEEYHQEYLEKNPGGYCHIPLDLFRQAESAKPDPSDFPTASDAATTSTAPVD